MLGGFPAEYVLWKRTWTCESPVKMQSLSYFNFAVRNSFQKERIQELIKISTILSVDIHWGKVIFYSAVVENIPQGNDSRRKGERTGTLAYTWKNWREYGWDSGWISSHSTSLWIFIVNAALMIWLGLLAFWDIWKICHEKILDPPLQTSSLVAPLYESIDVIIIKNVQDERKVKNPNNY